MLGGGWAQVNEAGDGSKLRAIHNKLSDDELTVLDGSVAK